MARRRNRARLLGPPSMPRARSTSEGAGRAATGGALPERPSSPVSASTSGWHTTKLTTHLSSGPKLPALWSMMLSKASTPPTSSKKRLSRTIWTQAPEQPLKHIMMLTRSGSLCGRRKPPGAMRCKDITSPFGKGRSDIGSKASSASRRLGKRRITPSLQPPLWDQTPKPPQPTRSFRGPPATNILSMASLESSSSWEIWPEC
mmetsp:Transcript_10851/g.38060  ORF Transcript_10851/g.38060 Transcript_10851/m.38060 type:complete len:203 (-) Transcript_10851:649-1257(-)